jgi:sugar lactone lactonase YvrE
MTFRTWLIGASVALVGASAWAQAAPEGPMAAFRRLRGEGVAAANAGDMALAAAKLAEADAAIPNHPGLTLLRAKVEAAQGHLPTAVALMERYAVEGFTTDVTRDELLVRISAESSFAPVLRRLNANAGPVGQLEVAGSIADAFIAEGIARDTARGRWLISGVHGRTIVALQPDGTPARYLDADVDADGLQGLAIDDARGILWAGSSGLPQAKDLPPEHRGRGGLLKIDLASGRLLARYDAPAATAGERAFGDLTVGPDGTVYVSDSLQGEIWRLRPGAATLERLVAAGLLGSPQGLVVTPDGRRLILADYGAGLHVVDLATGIVSRMPAPDSSSFIGVDGLIRDGDSLIAFQNGTSPQRVVRLNLDAVFSRIESWTVLAANLPNLEEPTSGVVVGDDLVFVARSQWSDFADDGSLRHGAVAPAVIARLKLR